MREPFPLSAAEVAHRIELPLERWRTICHVVCGAMLARELGLPDAEMEFMRPGPWPDPNNPSEPLWYHAYLRCTESGLVIDPTRWCYEGKSPAAAYIYVGDGDGVNYDGRPNDSPASPFA